MVTGTNAVERLLTQNEKDLIRLYKDSLKSIKQDIANLYEKMGTDVSIPSSMRFNRLNNMAKSIQAELISLAKKSKVVISDGIKSAFNETFNITGFAVESGLGVELGFSGVDRAVVSKVLSGNVIVDGVNQDPFGLIKWRTSVNEVVTGWNTKIKEGLTRGLIRGDSLQVIGKAIGEIGGKNAWQMQRILRTESGRAASQGYLTAFDDVSGSAERLGVSMDNKWLATLDAQTRDTHQTLDQQIAVAEADGVPMFTVRGLSTTAPRMFGVAAEDINCRCALTPVVEGLEDTRYRKARENGKSVLVRNQNYKQWAKSNNIKTEL
jgi:hypothetical protein